MPPAMREVKVLKEVFVEVEKEVEVIKEVIKEVEVVKEVIKEVEVEKIVEVVKEVPVDRIVEVEVVKEVVVEKIVEKVVVKEVPVEKIVEKIVVKEVPVEVVREVVVVQPAVKPDVAEVASQTATETCEAATQAPEGGRGRTRDAASQAQEEPPKKALLWTRIPAPAPRVWVHEARSEDLGADNARFDVGPQRVPIEVIKYMRRDEKIGTAPTSVTPPSRKKSPARR
jgi:hypothetical protein